jgi:hypothetical protein
VRSPPCSPRRRGTIRRTGDARHDRGRAPATPIARR